MQFLENLNVSIHNDSFLSGKKSTASQTMVPADFTADGMVLTSIFFGNAA
jgi:hypothetical protein